MKDVLPFIEFCVHFFLLSLVLNIFLLPWTIAFSYEKLYFVKFPLGHFWGTLILTNTWNKCRTAKNLLLLSVKIAKKMIYITVITKTILASTSNNEHRTILLEYWTPMHFDYFRRCFLDVANLSLARLNCHFLLPKRDRSIPQFNKVGRLERTPWHRAETLISFIT